MSEYIALSASIGPIPSEYTITSEYTTMSEYMMLSESSEMPSLLAHLPFPQVPDS
ncbi:MAG TPA: hypothetical protein VF596_19920 [Pyrinomonadaceae bacterium]